VCRVVRACPDTIHIKKPEFVHRLAKRHSTRQGVRKQVLTKRCFLIRDILDVLTVTILTRVEGRVLLRATRRSVGFLKRLNPLSPELNPICYLLALLAHHFLHVSRIRVKSLTLRLLMSYIHGAPIRDVSRSHTTTQHSR
jgi:transposase